MRPVHLLFLPLLLALSATSCQTPNPIKDASRPETVALALYGGFVIAEEAAADIAENPNTPANVKAGLKAADAKASPVAEQLKPLAKEVESIRADIAAGGGSQGALQTSLNKLNDWITQAAPLIQAFVDAVRGAKTTGAKTP